MFNWLLRWWRGDLSLAWWRDQQRREHGRGIDQSAIDWQKMRKRQL